MASANAHFDAAATPRTSSARSRSRPVPSGLVLGALGVVFGDIGTSPLHAIQTAFTIDDGGEPVLPAPGALVADPDGGPGFADDPDVPDALRLAQAQGLECDLDLDGPGPAYFVSRIALTAGDARGLRRWWKKLFVLLARNAASPVQYSR